MAYLRLCHVKALYNILWSFMRKTRVYHDRSLDHGHKAENYARINLFLIIAINLAICSGARGLDLPGDLYLEQNASPLLCALGYVASTMRSFASVRPPLHASRGSTHYAKIFHTLPLIREHHHCLPLHVHGAVP